MASNPMRFLGKISYDLNLLQVPLLLAFGPIIGLIFIFALSIGSHWLIEKPLISLGRNLVKATP